jgi:hypothetical protein
VAQWYYGNGENMNDGLKAGIHFMQGNRVIKSVAAGSDDWGRLFSRDGRTQSPEELAASVGWVFIAINKRRKTILEIPLTWERDGDEAETVPFTFKTREMVYRIDPAIQLMNAAYLLKLRAGRRFVGVRWIDPAAISPDKQSLTVEGYGRYIYETISGRQYLPAEDIIRFYDPMFREHDPGITAGQASSLAAQILFGMAETTDTFYDTNGLPVIAVIVPEATNDSDKEATRTAFERIFKRKRSMKGNKTIGLREGTKIEQISFAPKDLAMSELDVGKRQEILLAHEVPPAIIYSDVNTNQASDKMQQFIGALGVRLEMICETINNDPDIKATGFELVARVQEHWSMKGDEALRALAVTRFAAVMHPEAAAYLMGITREDFPEDMQDRIFLESTAASVVSSAGSVPGEPATDETDTTSQEMKAAELVKLERFVKSGKHKKRPFQSDILTSDEIAEVVSRHDAPFLESYP